MTTALIIVDVQNDFCAGGSLAVAGGIEVAQRIRSLLTGEHGYDYVVATRDLHAPDDVNGGHFPAPGHEPDYVNTWPLHCVAGTAGADYHPAIEALRTRIDAHITKGWGAPAYSGFQGTDSATGAPLADLLASAGVTDVHVVGIATDYCVKATALDAHRLGWRTTVLVDHAAGVTPETASTALVELQEAGVRLALGINPIDLFAAAS